MSVLLALAACVLPVPVERNCDIRSPYYPDEDGDGVGEPTTMYVGCEPPEGWVQSVGTDDGGDTDSEPIAPNDSDTAAADTGSGTGLWWDTGDTGVPWDSDDTWWNPPYWDSGDTSWWDTGP